MRRFRNLVTLLITFLLGAGAYITFDVVAPDLDVPQLSSTEVSVSMTFVSRFLDSSQSCPPVDWTLSPEVDHHLSGVAYSGRVSGDDSDFILHRVVDAAC